jgi:hypothetical protein
MGAGKVVLLLMIMVALLTACAPGPNQLTATPDEEGEVYGFWYGLWHGFISPFTFIVSLFRDSVSPYEVHNNGAWYNLGFLFGAMMIFGGGGGGATHAGRRRRDYR